MVHKFFSFVEVKHLSVNECKFVRNLKIKSPRTDKSHARHGDALDAVKLSLFLTAFFKGHGAVEVFAFVEIILLPTPDNAVKLAVGLRDRVIIPIAAEIVNVGI